MNCNKIDIGERIISPMRQQQHPLTNYISKVLAVKQFNGTTSWIIILALVCLNVMIFLFSRTTVTTSIDSIFLHNDRSSNPSIKYDVVTETEIHHNVELQSSSLLSSSIEHNSSSLSLNMFTAYIQKQSQQAASQNNNVKTQTTTTTTNPIFQQKIWTRNDVVQLLDTPECSAAIQDAKRRHPRTIAICPLCTTGIISNLYPYPIQYIKIPKAGSSAVVYYLTKKIQDRYIAKILCIDQPNTDIRFTIVRDPLLRISSAYDEVDIRIDRVDKPWLYSPNVTYRHFSRTNSETRIPRFLQFIKDYFDGHMTSWDAGMPHHMVGAALHLDAVRTESDGITKNNMLLPDIIGRLEYVDDFMSNLPHVLRQVHNLRTNNASFIHDPVSNISSSESVNDTIQKELKSLRKRKKIRSNIDIGLEWIIETLFKEDFICFGYPMRSKNLTLYKYLPTNDYKRAANNYLLSKTYFPKDVLEKFKSNYKNEHINPPSCRNRYNGNIRRDTLLRKVSLANMDNNTNNE